MDNLFNEHQLKLITVFCRLGGRIMLPDEKRKNLVIRPDGKKSIIALIDNSDKERLVRAVMAIVAYKVASDLEFDDTNNQLGKGEHMYLMKYMCDLRPLPRMWTAHLDNLQRCLRITTDLGDLSSVRVPIDLANDISPDDILLTDDGLLSFDVHGFGHNSAEECSVIVTREGWGKHIVTDSADRMVPVFLEYFSECKVKSVNIIEQRRAVVSEFMETFVQKRNGAHVKTVSPFGHLIIRTGKTEYKVRPTSKHTLFFSLNNDPALGPMFLINFKEEDVAKVLLERERAHTARICTL